MSIVRALEQVTREQARALGDAAPPAPFGPELPFAVTDAAAVARLARLAGSELRADYGAALHDVTASDPAAAAVTLPWWLATVEVAARAGGAPGAAFPGLSG